MIKVNDDSTKLEHQIEVLVDGVHKVMIYINGTARVDVEVINIASGRLIDSEVVAIKYGCVDLVLSKECLKSKDSEILNKECYWAE
jgi:hypothetical protein